MTIRPLHSILLAALGSGVCALANANPAQAVGFIGGFSPSNWQIKNYLGPTSPPPVGTPATSTYNDPAYACSSSLIVTCIQGLNSGTGQATLVGSDSSGNGADSTAWTTEWEMINGFTDPLTTISFNWTYLTFDSSADDESFFYTIDPNNVISKTILSDVTFPGSDSGSISLILPAGWRFGFGVSTQTNLGGPGILQLSNSAASRVPGPLPLMGAAAAFSWSRRLRKRQRAASDQAKS